MPYTEVLGNTNSDPAKLVWVCVPSVFEYTNATVIVFPYGVSIDVATVPNTVAAVYRVTTVMPESKNIFWLAVDVTVHRTVNACGPRILLKLPETAVGLRS
jgi:hypothetical protein